MRLPYNVQRMSITPEGVSYNAMLLPYNVERKSIMPEGAPYKALQALHAYLMRDGTDARR